VLPVVALGALLAYAEEGVEVVFQRIAVDNSMGQ
jgi:hypothetical protein